MQKLQTTPSVCFQFEDDNKGEFSQIDFQFSCTNQKKSQQMDDQSIRLTPLHLANRLQISNRFRLAQQQTVQTLHTQQFFEQFESNFVVTFDEVKKTEKMQDPESSDSRNQKSDSNEQRVIHEKNENYEQEERISFPVLKKRKRSLLSIVEMKSQIINKSFKESTFLPVMRIKKRSNFKNKQNLVNDVQSFKVCSNRSMVGEPLKLLVNGSFTCRHANEKQKQYFSSKGTGKEVQMTKGLSKKQQKANIFWDNRSELILKRERKDEGQGVKSVWGKKQCLKAKKRREPSNISVFKKFPLVR